MTMTLYEFAMIMGLGVGGDLIPFDTDIGEWNTMGLYLLSALVTFSRVRFYDWGGAGLATLYGYMTLAPEPIEEFPSMVPYSKRYDGRCARGDEEAKAPTTRKARATRARARGAPPTE
ncbi:hypothetical protein CsSME_00010752 [Camellia sinensis var. sinensis]